ncbi:hypothetical protein, partial [Ruminococcus sp.]|uniref:hypothetical protein n=1 Tax=Ruminococcus sp. TaxID=41978 RepID=UPI003FD77AF7
LAVLIDVYADFPHPTDLGEFEKQQYIGHECVVSVVVTMNNSLVGKAAEMCFAVNRKSRILVKLTKIV